MTKLNHERPYREPDPGRVVEVFDNGGVWSGNDDHPFETEVQRRRRQEGEREGLLKRSEELRYKAMIKKYGAERAVALGVPQAFIADQRQAKLRAQQKEQRAREKRERRAARRMAGV